VEEGTWLNAETTVRATAAADQTTNRKTKTKRGRFRIGISWEQRAECTTQFCGDSSGNAGLARRLSVAKEEAALTIPDLPQDVLSGSVVFSGGIIFQHTTAIRKERE